MRRWRMATLRVSCPALLVTICLAGPAAAIDVPLSGLAGGYEYIPTMLPDFGYPTSRSIDFTIPDDVASIEQMTAVISGQWVAGVAMCDIDDPFATPLIPELTLQLSSDAFPGDLFFTGFRLAEGQFTGLTASFLSCCPMGVLGNDQLLGADLHAQLSVDVGMVGMCWTTIDTYGVLDDVRLVLTGTVPAQRSDWGGIKALYR
jgi:hypothetical protein